METYTLPDIAQKYCVAEDALEFFVNSNNISLDGSDDSLQQLLPFIENQPDRSLHAVKKNGTTFLYKKTKISIFENDAISFLKTLPSNSVDIITTDPAYSGMNNKLRLGKGRIIGKYCEKGSDKGKWFSEFEDSIENYTRFLTECKRVLKQSTGHIYIMFDSYSLLSLGGLIRDFFDVKNIITWDKINIGMGHYYRRRHEYIVFCTNGNTRKIKNRSFPDVWRFKRIHNAKYPTQKPVEVFQSMIHASAEKGFTICDPFLGSGSSAIAAIKNECNFIGCDISKKSIDVSGKRIREYIDTNLDILQNKPASVEGKIFWE